MPALAPVRPRPAPGAVVAVIADDEAGTAHRLFESGGVRGRSVPLF
ncbi:hypothetical protein QD712_06590 [Streptomyces acidiscabies]